LDRAIHNLYYTARWSRLRKAQLKREPLCHLCLALGRTTPATICDHVEPHKGDVAKFWAGPFQSLCKQCHDSAKQVEERSGLLKGCDQDGYPVDPKHPWGKK